jgi:hypothetical protein
MIVSKLKYSFAISYATLVVIIMTAITTDRRGNASTPGPSLPSVLALIPAQVPGAKHPMPVRKNRNKCHSVAPAATQSENSNQYDVLSDNDDDSAGDKVVYRPPPNNTFNVSSDTEHASSDSGSIKLKPDKTRSGKHKVVLSRYGNLPDVEW